MGRGKKRGRMKERGKEGRGASRCCGGVSGAATTCLGVGVLGHAPGRVVECRAGRG